MPFSDKAEICPIKSADIGQYEKIALPFIVSALEHTDGETSLRQILSDIATQKRQLWLIKQADGEFIAGVVSEVYTTETGIKIGEVALAAGRDYLKWDHFIEVISAWFKDIGCHYVQVTGRAAWVRKLKNNGFEQRYVILRRGLQ